MLLLQEFFSYWIVHLLLVLFLVLHFDLTMLSFFDLVPLALTFLKYQVNGSNAEDTMKMQRDTVAKSTRLNGCLLK